MASGALGEGRPRLRDLFLLRPDVVFLNHGSFGARPRSVLDEYQRWQLELEQQPVEFLGRRFTEVMRGAREAVAAYLGAQADDLVFVPNATTGLNAVARSLPLEPGDEVLTSDHEYGALDSTWRFVCSSRGASYVHRPVPLPVTSPEEVVQAIWAGVTPRTRVLFLSHITSPTALTFPVEELVRRARAANILTVIDGAHVPGQRPLDLEKLGADFYSGNLHKWLCAPAGSAFLHARREVQHCSDRLLSAGDGTAPNSWREGVSRGMSSQVALLTSRSGRAPATRPPTWPRRRRFASRPSTTGPRSERGVTSCSSGRGERSRS